MTPEAAGEFYFAIVSGYSNDIHRGEIMTDDFRANTGIHSRLSVGGQSSGLVDTAGDRNRFAISLVSGQSYEFHLVSTGLADPNLTLYSSNGNALLTDADGRWETDLSLKCNRVVTRE